MAFERILNWLFGMAEPSEEATEYNGLLSYATEVHAALIGGTMGLVLGFIGLAVVLCVALGLGACKKKMGNRKALKELKTEPWYGIGFSLGGFAVNHFLGIDPATWILF